jgi:hypothetical protein
MMEELDIDDIMEKVRNEVKLMKEKEMDGLLTNVISADVPADLSSDDEPDSDWGPVASYIDNARYFCDRESDFFQPDEFNKSILNAARVKLLKRVGKYTRKVFLYMLSGLFNTQISFNRAVVSSMNGMILKAQYNLTGLNNSINELETSIGKKAEIERAMLKKHAEEIAGSVEKRTRKRQEEMEEGILLLKKKTDELAGMITDLRRRIEER